ncbi:GNAT family N-acetyltransferase [Hoeflea olei]|uniref:GNAT family N-acetyltransferase n=1 Tax=Hoeflea olei TaxID=1480615 RepID=UPI001495EBFF|nr:GNAT family N-acetyltransferase [Hoeflea olei]
MSLKYLGPSDAQDFCAHIHELHYEDFRDRFNGLVSDAWLDKYIARSLNEAIVIGAYIGDHLVAVAELHTGGQIAEHEGESAFSVSSDWRRKGLGTILLKALLRAASENNISTIIVETGSQNHAMKALARKFGAKMQFAADQSVGRINVADGLRLAARFVAHRTFPVVPVTPTDMAAYAAPAN